jgi:hypothetical protein
MYKNMATAEKIKVFLYVDLKQYFDFTGQLMECGRNG